MSEHDPDDVGQLRELGKDLPWDRPDAARRDAVRSSLLIAASEGDANVRPRWFVVGGAFAAGALAAAAALLLIVRSHHEPVASGDRSAQIEASSAADFERQITHTAKGADEIVRIHNGRVSLAVGALPAGDRVRVATRDAEVEGQGSYEVAVRADEIREVAVKTGTAAIRIEGQQEMFLSAGQTWKARIVAADLQPTPVPAPLPNIPLVPTIASTPPPVAIASTPTVVPAPSRSHPAIATSPNEHAVAEVTPPVSPNPIEPAPAPEAPVVAAKTQLEQHFAAGWGLLKSGKSAEAARELGAAADVGGDEPLAADARYFQAVALTKAGRKTEAEHALVAFLDRSPHAIRRGRASVMLGRLIAERGDAASARAWFESATHDADATVVAAARAGLASLPH